MGQKKLIKSLQGLRGIMIGIVVVFHIYGINIIYGGGAEAMPFFFILSGFVLSLTYSDKKSRLSIKDEVLFMKKRIKKIYPLYFIVITVLMFFVLLFILKGKSEILEYIKSYFFDVFMLQSWSLNEKIHYGLTGSTWFVSSLMFSYLLFLPADYLFEKISKKSYRLIQVLLAVSILLIIFYQFVFKTLIVKESFYFTYFFPPYRALEFISGMLLAYVFLKEHSNSGSDKKILYTFFEGLTILFFIVERFGCKYLNLPEKYDWRLSSVEIIMMCLLIYVFAEEKGYFSKLLSLKPFMMFASISFEIYLLHQPVQMILGFIFDKINFDSFNGIIVVVFTIFIAVTGNGLSRIVKRKRKTQNK